MHGLKRKVNRQMINIQDWMQTKAFARQDGAILGCVWIVSFVLTMIATSPDHYFIGLLANLLTLSTPFVVAKRLRNFRDYALNGCISFRRGLFYCGQTFFNATLLLTIVQYLWFRFMDTSMFMEQIQTQYQLVMHAYQMTAEQTKTLLEAVTMMRPIAWASMFMLTDILVAIVLSPIIAALMMRKVAPQQL